MDKHKIDEIETEGKRILIVDNNRILQKLIYTALEKSGEDYFLKRTTGGFEAAQLIDQFVPDLIVLDIFMPTVDGFRVCKDVKTHYPDTRIVAMTGNGNDETRRKILEAGADRYLTKPFDMRKLLDCIKEELKLA